FGQAWRWCEKEKPRVVLAVILQVFSQNGSAVDFRRALSGDGRAPRILAPNHLADASGGVFARHPFDPGVIVEETFALSERDGMRFDNLDTLERCSRRTDQVMRDRNDDFGSDA